jgi:hypothetical protein
MGPQSQIFLLLRPMIILVTNINLCFLYFWVEFCFVSFVFKISFLPPLPFVFSNSVIFFSNGDEMVTAYIYIRTYPPIRFAWVSHVNRRNMVWMFNVVAFSSWNTQKIFKTIYTTLQQKMSIKLSTRKSEKLIIISTQHLMTLN